MVRACLSAVRVCVCVDTESKNANRGTDETESQTFCYTLCCQRVGGLAFWIGGKISPEKLENTAEELQVCEALCWRTPAANDNQSLQWLLGAVSVLFHSGFC